MKDHQSSKPDRYQTLDHWRGIACLLVVIYHATLPLCDERRLQRELSAVPTATTRVIESNAPIARSRIASLSKLMIGLTNQMHFGVGMFFVISGYCVTASAESLRRSQRPLRDYFRRRAIRIYPPFWAAVGCSILFCFAMEAICPGSLGRAPWPLRMPWELSASQWIGCLTLTGTWLGNLTGDSTSCFPAHAWTLCYEEQFYAVVGVLLVLSGRHFFRGATLVTIAIVAIDLICLLQGISIKGWFFDEHWFMFAAGIGLYWQLNRATRRQSLISQSICIAAIVGLTIAALSSSRFGPGSHFSAWRVVSALMFAVLLAQLKPFDRQISELNGLRWLKSCGVMCYSIYLVHLFPGKALSHQLMLGGYRDDLSTLLICVPLCLATAISLGYIFHVTVERRFLNTNPGVQVESTRALSLDRPVIAIGYPTLFQPAFLSIEDEPQRLVGEPSSIAQLVLYVPESTDEQRATNVLTDSKEIDGEIRKGVAEVAPLAEAIPLTIRTSADFEDLSAEKTLTIERFLTVEPPIEVFGLDLSVENAETGTTEVAGTRRKNAA